MLDSRVPRDLQKGDDVYINNDWDRGHIVPRTAVVWGDDDEAKAASRAVFFYPNSVPQHSKFNQGIWARLEQHIIETADVSYNRVSVFAGPVYYMTDYEYRGSKIPQSFWKIVAVSNPQNSNWLRAATVGRSCSPTLITRNSRRSNFATEPEILLDAVYFELIVPTTAVWAAVRHAVLALMERA